MSLEQKIAAIDGCEFHADQDLTSLTTFKLKSRGDLVEVTSTTALQTLLPLLRDENRDYLVVGWGANQILPDVSKELVIHLDIPFDLSTLTEIRDEYHLPASIGLNHLTALAVKYGLKGWEVFTGIPASLGGAIYMNAGTNLGEIGALVSSVTLVSPSGDKRTEIITPQSFSYRKNHFVKPGEIIVEATLKHLGIDPEIPSKIKSYLEYRKASQPLASKNCGCVFKNPMKTIPAGKLIDQLQLKGVKSGGLRISTKHGNFMENNSGATWNDFETLVNIVKFEVDHFYGIEFELEVKIPYH